LLTKKKRKVVKSKETKPKKELANGRKKVFIKENNVGSVYSATA